MKPLNILGGFILVGAAIAAVVQLFQIRGQLDEVSHDGMRQNYHNEC